MHRIKRADRLDGGGDKRILLAIQAGREQAEKEPARLPHRLERAEHAEDALSS